MNICLIKPYTSRKRDYEQRHLDIGLAFLARSLLNQGHRVEILDCMRERMDRKSFASWVKGSNFDVYGLKVYSHGLFEARDQVREIKRQIPGAVVMMGGPHPSGAGEEIFSHIPEADFAFRGEAEIGLPRLLEVVGSLGGSVVRGENSSREELAFQPSSHLATQLKEIPGLIYREGEEVRICPPQYLDNLDDIGLPALELMDIPGYLRENRRLVQTQYLPLVTSRGCPFSCSYCAAALISGKKVRRHSLEFIMEWLECYRREYGAGNFAVADDAFTENREYILEFCEALLKRDFRMKWDCGTNAVRLDSLDPEVLRMMERAGCFYLSVGVESGSEKVLRDMRRKTDLNEIRDKVNLIKQETNMIVGGFFILGYPNETRRDLWKTLRLSWELPLDLAQFWIFSPYPGTEIVRRLEKEGRLGKLDYSSCHFGAASLPTNGYSTRTIKKYQRFAYLSFYARPRIISSTVKKNIRSLADLRRMVEYFFR